MRALVVGGRGLMGRWFCSFLAGMGHDVVTVDPAGGTKGHARVASVAQGLEGLGAKDLVLVATPMERSAAVLAEVRREGTKALVADICSIKAPVRKELARLAAARFKVASLHPMWGPDAVLLSDKNLLVLDCGSPAAVRQAKGLFRGTAVQVRELPLARHDELMAWALALPHVTNLAFSLALARSGMAPGELEHLGGPTMKGQMHVARGVSRENKDLYHGIQALNPHARAVRAQLDQAFRDLRGSLGKPQDFRALMAACEAYYDHGTRAPVGKRGGRRR